VADQGVMKVFLQVSTPAAILGGSVVCIFGMNFCYNLRVYNNLIYICTTIGISFVQQLDLHLYNNWDFICTTIGISFVQQLDLHCTNIGIYICAPQICAEHGIYICTYIWSLITWVDMKLDTKPVVLVRRCPS